MVTSSLSPLLLLLQPLLQLLLLPLLHHTTTALHVDQVQCQGRVASNTTASRIKVHSGRGALLHPGNGGDFGTWGAYDLCERGSYAHAFQLRVEAPLGMLGDDTALNGVRLYCRASDTHHDTGTVTSAGQCWGAWLEPRVCEAGTFLTGLQLWVEGPQGVLDDVAATDLDMMCGDGRVLSGGGVCWGDSSGWLRCPEEFAVCGLRTRMEEVAGLMGDNTALNDLMVLCCDLP